VRATRDVRCTAGNSPRGGGGELKNRDSVGWLAVDRGFGVSAEKRTLNNCAAQHTKGSGMLLKQNVSGALRTLSSPAHARMTTGSVPGLHLVNRRYIRSGCHIHRRGLGQRQGPGTCVSSECEEGGLFRFVRKGGVRVLACCTPRPSGMYATCEWQAR
jgi:hypothetical protein